MSVLAKIIRYFSKYNFADDIRQRVWHRLGIGIDGDGEKALHEVWETQSDERMGRGALDDAYYDVAEKVGIEAWDDEDFHWGRLLLRVAACAIPLAMLAGAYFFYRSGVEQRKLLADIRLMQEFCGKGEIRKLLLPDSTEVWLNAGSVLVYPSHFGGGERNVTLVGEAFFKVRHIDNQPFMVSVNHLVVKDIGTSFNIQSYPNWDDTRVTLKEGIVSVSDGHGDYRLSPNQQLVYSNLTGHVNVRDVDANEYVAWSSGELQFNDVPLPTVLKLLENRYDVHFQILTDKHDSQRVRLRFDSHESIRGILSVISAVVPDFKWKMEGRNVIVK